MIGLTEITKNIFKIKHQQNISPLRGQQIFTSHTSHAVLLLSPHFRFDFVVRDDIFP